MHEMNNELRTREHQTCSLTVHHILTDKLRSKIKDCLMFWPGFEPMTSFLEDWGPFLESPSNFPGSKSNIQIKMYRIKSRES